MLLLLSDEDFNGNVVAGCAGTTRMPIWCECRTSACLDTHGVPGLTRRSFTRLASSHSSGGLCKAFAKT